MAPQPEDPIREARARAANSLKPFSPEQYQGFLLAWGGAAIAIGALIVAMVSAQMLTTTTAWRLFGAGALLVLLAALFFTYVGRLVERSVALRELLATQRDYDSLLESVRDERDQARASLTRAEMQSGLLAGLVALQATVKGAEAGDGKE